MFSTEVDPNRTRQRHRLRVLIVAAAAAAAILIPAQQRAEAAEVCTGPGCDTVAFVNDASHVSLYQDLVAVVTDRHVLLRQRQRRTAHGRLELQRRTDTRACIAGLPARCICATATPRARPISPMCSEIPAMCPLLVTSTATAVTRSASTVRRRAGSSSATR